MKHPRYSCEDFDNPELVRVITDAEELSKSPAILAELIDPTPNAYQYALAGFLFNQRNGAFPRTQSHCITAVKLLPPFQQVLTEEVRKMRLSQAQFASRMSAEETIEGWAWDHVQHYCERQQPHEMGTVAEIATKYGISKTEVRRLKAAGQLHTLSKEDA